MEARRGCAMSLRETPLLEVHAQLGSEGEAIVTAQGELCFGSQGEFSNVLHDVLDTGARRVVLELAGISFLDSAGVRALLQLQRRSEREGWVLQLRSVSPVAQRVMLVSGIRARLNIAE